MLAQLLRRPRDTPAMVAVGGGGEGHLLGRRGFKLFKRKRININLVLFTQQLGNGVSAAEHLESI
ncbi:hypothetical protein D3C76_1731930 [compost metagenome]